MNVTIKSVNHRFLDVVVKAPQSLGAIETRARALVQQKLARGRVEIGVWAESTAMPAREVSLDEPLLEQVAAMLAAARDRGLVTGTLSVSDLLRIPQVLEISTRADHAAGATAALLSTVDEAIASAVDALAEMRATEGAFLAADLDARLATMGGFVDALELHARDGQRQLEARLTERVRDLPPDLRGDPAAVAQEIVRIVARSDVDEEVVRMRGHLGHWRALAASEEPCGRKLDFLVQEMNREINTIGSKVEGTRATEVVIAAKAELERLREQVQNVE